MISLFLAPRSLPSFLSEYSGLVATTGLVTHYHIFNLHGQVSQVLVFAQLALSSPTFYAYRTSRVVWVPLFFSYGVFSLAYFFLLFSSVCPFLWLLFASGFKIWKEVVFFLCHISYAVPRYFDPLFTHCSFFKAWVWGFFAQSSPSHFHSREAQFLSFNTIIYILVPTASWGPEHEDQEAPGTQDLKS